MKKALVTLLVLGILAAAAGAGAFLYGKKLVTAPGPLAQTKIILIDSGTSLRGIAAELDQQGVITRPVLFSTAARLAEWHEKRPLQAGEYEFAPHISIAGVIALLQSGKTYQHKITIPEGLTSAEVVQLLNAEPVLTGTIDKTPPEGSLMPETYSFSYGDNRNTLITRMQKAMKETVANLWKHRSPDLPFTNPEQGVTLASIIEKETAQPQERARIAGVFINRLKRGMKLQSDPTVIYAITHGLGKLDRSLNKLDLKTQSPYNTYLVTGLPPGPIANPGKSSLYAAFNPEKNNYLYFVADGTGGHAFSATLHQHDRNIRHWLKVRREQEKTQKPEK